MSATTQLLLVVTLLLSAAVHNQGPAGGRALSWSFGGGGGGGDSASSEGGSSKASNSLNNNNNNNNRHAYYKNRDLQLEELLSQGEEKCVNKPCVQSEQCCPGSVCVDTHSTGKRQVTGTCLPIYGVNEGDYCTDDDDCEPGLRCLANTPLIQLSGSGSGSSSSSSSGGGSSSSSSSGRGRDGDASVLIASMGGSSRGSASKSCQPPGPEMMKKQYNDECSTSAECDASHGLCCQIIKRHRMAPRKVCLYFSDPKICLGQVDVTFARPMAYSSYSASYTPNERDYFRARIG